MAKIASLVPNGEKWMDLDLNVLLIGLHGVGKTAAVLDLCKEKNLKLKYYSCSTLDPYTDLVGVPDPVTGEDGQRELQMVRPREVDDAEILFFDELNRAHPKVLNAVLEIIQFRSINGERLPNLRMIWAAINPPGHEYQVEELDPALVDRFDVFEDVAARPSVEYMASRGIRPGIAKALVAWWNEQNRTRRNAAEAITPRRLEKIGVVYEATKDHKSAIPNWFTAVDRNKLKSMLQSAENQEKAKGGTKGKVGNAPKADFEYSPEYFAENSFEVATYLEKNQTDLETHKAAKEVLIARHAPRLVRDYAEILDALVPSIREAMLTEMNEPKFKRLVEEMAKVPDYRKDKIAKFAKAVEAEAKNRG
jgi:MoxR-like ATPase